MPTGRLATLLRWAGLIVSAGVLVMVLSARGSAGLQPRPVREPIYLSRASGQPAASQYLPPAVRDLAPSSVSGPFTSTAAAFSVAGTACLPVSGPAVAQPDLPELDAGESLPANLPSLPDPVVQPPSSGAGAGPAVPLPQSSFDGLDHNHAAPVFPPDTNGDVGPTDYIQTVNDNIAIFNKALGVQLTSCSFNTLFSAAPTSTPCDANNRGDPVALYDAQADRFIVSDFAFVDAHASPYYECIAVSKTGDPVLGGWYLFALRADDAGHQFLADYPKMGVWPDGIYMSANMFDCTGACSGADFKGVRAWALNRADLYSGSTLHAVYFDTGADFFTLLPSNLRGPLPPAGTPNYFVSNDGSLFALDVFKFHVDFTTPLSSTFSAGPTQIAIAAYNQPTVVPEISANNLDSLGSRLMVQNQYRNIGGVESLWVAHTVNNAPSGVRWYQLDVSGGTVATTPVQQSTYQPDSSFRWVPSLAVDKFGNMLVGYSVSSASMHPDIRYAGRLVTDTLNSLSPEATLITGGGGQTGSCGGNTCIRWGDYSGMTVDPVDDCTFWYTTEYYATTGNNWQTRIGSIRYPACGSTNSVSFVYLPLVATGSSAPAGWTTIMQEGFEGAFPSAGWTVSDFASNAFIWGERNCRAASGTNSLWAMGGGSSGAGQACGANYIDSTNDWAIYGDFSLAGATAAQFNLKLWLNTQPLVDTACVMASHDDNNYFGDCYYGSSGNVFVPESLDLSNVSGLGDLRGQPGLSVAVLFQTDATVHLANGAFVDDLLLRKCLVASCPASVDAPTANNHVQRRPVHLVRPPH
jgi:hypothetical protein